MLKCKHNSINFKELRDVLQIRQNRFEEIGNYPWEQAIRSDDIDLTVTYAVLQHLGVLHFDELQLLLNRGADRAHNYFLGNWWQLNPTDRTYLDKSNPNSQLIWSIEYINTCFVSGLLNRWDALSVVSDWIDEQVCTPAVLELLTDDPYYLLAIYIASRLRRAPLGSEKKLADSIAAYPRTGASLIMKAFDYANSSDQVNFEMKLIESLRYFEMHEVQDVANVNYWVAIHHSFVCAFAEHRRLRVPELPPNLAALVVQRSTIGLS